MKDNTRRAAQLALGLSALIVLAACGSSTASVTPSTQPSVSTSATPTTKLASGSTVVMAATTAKLGSVLVDAKGMTLYTLTNGGAQVACTGQCASFWPPLLLPSDTMTALGASGVTGLGTASSAAGLQVTENGAPLYRFSIDKAPGDTKGEGISSFGGTWHVVKAAGTSAPATMAPVVTSPAATAPPTTVGGGYGGY
jgi:predicted lipoprotein with Yx(FWY)xxD motif